jgi:hypothetical protein
MRRNIHPPRKQRPKEPSAIDHAKNIRQQDRRIRLASKLGCSPPRRQVMFYDPYRRLQGAQTNLI